MAIAATKIELRPLTAIHPYERNAKKHPTAQIKQLAKIIGRHGFDVPIVVDGQGVVIKGHGRLLAAKHLGLTKVPVIVRDDLSAAMVREARVADNRVPELGSWDNDLLLEDVKDAMSSMPDFDLESLGLRSSFVREHIRLDDNVDALADTFADDGLRYSVIVDFDNEQAQAAFLQEQESKGMQCRLLIS